MAIIIYNNILIINKMCKTRHASKIIPLLPVQKGPEMGWAIGFRSCEVLF